MKTTLIFATFAVLATQAHAETAFSTFGPGDSYQVGAGPYIGFDNNQHIGMQFESATTGMLQSIELALFSQSPGSVTISLFTDNAGVMGSLMTSWSDTIDSEGIRTYSNASPTINLTSGSQYWILATNDQNPNFVLWNWSSPEVTGRRFLANNGAPAGTYSDGVRQTAFRVNTEAVPEPATMTVLALGALAALKRRKK